MKHVLPVLFCLGAVIVGLMASAFVLHLVVKVAATGWNIV